MPGKAAVTVPLPAAAAPQKSCPFVLKKIMDIPPPNILEEGDDGVSASLTPAIWEKTIPYDGETFHLEYMDLDEFLLENGIPVSLEEEELQRTLTSVETKGKPIPKVIALAPAAPLAAPPVAAVNEVSIPEPPDPSPSEVITDAEESVTVTTLQPAKLEEDEEEKRQEEESLTEEAPAEAEVKKTGK
ncbi:hypothetical protein GOODEAATRI_009684 [Goodea atripinnis]|uniref:Thyrotroph embryonic factor n=1 Tax=Goodea atripinnis TaxID=208336 RepID=A0ABV0N008_9TELE